MTSEFQNHVESFVTSLTANAPQIHYQVFDFSNVSDNRSKLTNLNSDKNKVSCLNLEMVGEDIGRKGLNKLLLFY